MDYDELTEQLLENGFEFDKREEMAEFVQCVHAVLDHEGGYVNDKDDPGGETKYGISKRAYPNVDIKGLTKHGACELYYKDYWRKYRVSDLPERIRNCYFDMCVNMGGNRACTILQKVVNAKGGTLKIDGRIGKNTVAQTFKRNPEPDRMVAYRVKYYCDLIVSKPRLEKYFYGWFKRAVADM